MGTTGGPDDREPGTRRDPARRYGPSGRRSTAPPPLRPDPGARKPRTTSTPPPGAAQPPAAPPPPAVPRPGAGPPPGPPRPKTGPKSGGPAEKPRPEARRPEPRRPEDRRPDRSRPDQLGAVPTTPVRSRAGQADKPPLDQPRSDKPRPTTALLEAPPRPAPSRPAPPRTPPADELAPPDGSRARRRTGQVALAVASALVFALTGVAWAAIGTIGSSSALSGPVGNAADGATDILLVGVDSRTDAQGHPLPRNVLQELGASATDGSVNTDTMILVRIPNDGSRAVAFSIPRDSYVTIPGEGRRDKINSAYPAAKAESASQLVQSGDTDPQDVDVKSSEAGRQELVKTVGALTGLTVDHFAEVNLLGFFNLTNAIGGVDVCLKEPTDDDFSGAHFRPGPQTVAGHDALAFVRQRHGLPQGDLDRIRRQQAFLAGLSHKVLSGGTLADPITLGRLIGSVKQSVVLDSGWDVLGFAQQMQNVSAGNVAFLTIPTQGNGDIDGRGDVIRVDPAAVQSFVADAIGPAEPPPADTGPPSGTIPVEVSNATKADGAAARVVAVLSAQGYGRAVAGNAADTSATRSEVRFAPGSDAAGARVARALGNLPARPDPTVPPGGVRAVLAGDYRGPGSTPPGSPSRSSSSSAPAPAPPPAPAITADGVPCIN